MAHRAKRSKELIDGERERSEMWTKLLWMTFNTAFKRQYIDYVMRAPNLSLRYKGVLKKQFRIAGVPWIFE